MTFKIAKRCTLTPFSHSAAVVYNWLTAATDQVTSVLGSIKRPKESRVWFNYPWQTSESGMGQGTAPSKTVRIVEGPNGNPAWTMQLADYGDRRTNQPVVNPNYPKVGTTNYADNPFGQLLGAVDQEGRTVIYNYASNGMDLVSVQVRDGSNWRTLVAYSDYQSHQPGTITAASGLLTSITYDAQGQPEEVIRTKGGNSEKTKFTYTSGYLTKVEQTDPANVSGLVTISEFTYDSAGRVRTMTDADDYTLTYDYDAIDRVTLITHPDQTTEQFVYEKLDLYAVKDRGGLWTRTLYNANRLPVLVQDPAGLLTQIEWCQCGDIRRIIDPMGRVTHWKHNAAGQLMEKVYTDGSKETYTYEPLSGRLSTVTPPSGSGEVASYTYHLSGQLAKEEYADATPTATYSFNDFMGRLTERIDGIGTTQYTYHPMDGITAGAGQVKEINGPWEDDTLSYVYEWRNILETRRVMGDNATVQREETVEVDSLGRLKEIISDLGTFNYVYQAGNVGPRVNQVTGPGGMEVGYEYFPSSATGGKALFLEAIDNQAGSNMVSSFGYDYDVSGRATEWEQVQGVQEHTWNLGYNRSSELVEAERKNGVGAVQENRSWTYDPAGNRIVDNDGSTAMTAFFNELNELERQGGAGQTLIQGTVDKPAYVSVDGQPAKMENMPGTEAVRFSRVVQVSEGTNTVEIEAVDADDNVQVDTWQFTVPGVQRTYTYDANGNMLSDGVRTYTWDAKNRLKSVAAGGQTYAWEYDGLDRRVEELVNGVLAKRFVWDGAQIVQERDANNQAVRNYYGNGVRIESDNYTYTTDHLGSVREVVDASGNVVASYSYDLWGNRTKIGGSVDTSVGFTGHYTHEETGLVLTLYRAYDPEIGRWLSRDPIGEAGGINLYGYVANDPINLLDPLGLWQVTIGGGFGGFGYITFGNNGGKKNFGFGFGAGAGGILQYSPDNSPINSNCSADGTTQVGLAAFAEGNLGGIVNSGIRGDLLVQHWSERQSGVGLHGNVRGVGRIVGSSGINLPGFRNLPSGGIDFVGGGFEGYVQASSSSVGCFERGGGAISSGPSFGFSASGFVGLQIIREW